MGTKYLQKVLNEQLAAHIQSHLPDLLQQLEVRLKIAQGELLAYGDVSKEGDLDFLSARLYKMVESAKKLLRTCLGSKLKNLDHFCSNTCALDVGENEKLECDTFSKGFILNQTFGKYPLVINKITFPAQDIK